MEELLNEYDSTSKMPQMRRKFLCFAQSLPELWDAPCVSEQQDTISDTWYSQRYCRL